jgi:hypothetical protein
LVGEHFLLRHIRPNPSRVGRDYHLIPWCAGRLVGVGKCAPDIVGRVGKVVDLTALVATFPQSTELVLHYLPCLDKAPVLNNIPAAVECAF